MEVQSISNAQNAPSHDVIIIGGGINGLAVARDCALRGLRVILFEKHDYAFGASGNNSGMIHGGPRYLTSEPHVTEQSCRDSGFIQQIAPHLLFRIPFLFPVPKGRAAKITLAAVDAFFSLYDVYQPLKKGKSHALLTSNELAALEPGLAGEYEGAVTFDEWGINGARLCVLHAIAAREHGAEVLNHHEVCSLTQTSEGRVHGVMARDVLTGRMRTVSAHVVVNATGAWSPITAGLATGAKVELRPGKGIHVLYERRLSNYGVVTSAMDGRQIFLMPWDNLSWIATTDDDFWGDLDHPRATIDEVRYLVEGISRTMPAAREARIIGTTVGVRPTLFGWGMYEDQLSREHKIIDHGQTDQVLGLFSMVGGKLASFRVFAEEMTDVLMQCLGRSAECRTHEIPLPGGENPVNPAFLADRYRVPVPAVRRLTSRHGARAENVLMRVVDAPRERAFICPCEPVMDCEVRYACTEESARTLEDVARRTRLGLGPCGGMRCAYRAASIVAEECGYSAVAGQRMANAFLQERYASRAVGLGPDQIRQEELLASRYLLAGGVADGVDDS